MRRNLLLAFCHVEAIFVLLTTLEPVTSNPISGVARASVIEPEVLPIGDAAFDVSSYGDDGYDLPAEEYYATFREAPREDANDEDEGYYDDIDYANDPETTQAVFDYIALPVRFQRYDLNGDGFVTALELSDATGTDLEDSAKPFRVADLDDDGLLTEEELARAPWVFDQIYRSGASTNRHGNPVAT